MNRKLLSLSLLLMLLPLVILGSTRSAFGVNVPIGTPGNYIIESIDDPETVDPAWAYDSASGALIANIYESLIKFDREYHWEFIPCLSTVVPSYANGLIQDINMPVILTDGIDPETGLSNPGHNQGSGLTQSVTYVQKIMFPIRFTNDAGQPVFFHSGDTLKMEDVEYSFERLMVQDRSGGPTWMVNEPIMGIGTYRVNLADPLQDEIIDSAFRKVDLVPFTSMEKHRENVALNAVFDPGEYAYRDVGNIGSGLVSPGDVRLTAVGPYPAGTTVMGDYIYQDVDVSGDITVGDVRLTAVGSYLAGSTVASGDVDIGLPLFVFASNEKHQENVASNGAYDIGEYIYNDVDASGKISVGDVRLTAVGVYPAGSTVACVGEYIYKDVDNSGTVTVGDERLTAVPPYAAGSTVGTGNTDIGQTLVAFIYSIISPLERHRENIAANNVYDVGEYFYIDLDDSGDVTIDDVRLTAVESYPTNSTVASGDTDIGQVLVSFAPNEKHSENIAANNRYDPIDTDVGKTLVAFASNEKHSENVVANNRYDPIDADIGQVLVAFASNEKHSENITVNAIYDLGEYTYRDVDVSGSVTPGDVRLTAVPPYVAGSTVASGDSDTYFSIYLQVRYAPILGILAQSWASIVNKSFMIAHRDWPGTWNNWVQWHDPAEAPVDNAGHVMDGTGPFALGYDFGNGPGYWRVGVEWSVVRFPSYWGGWPAPVSSSYLNRVTKKVVYEWSTRLADFKAGTADTVYVPRPYIQQVPGPGIRGLKDLPSLSADAMFFNFAIDPTSPYVGTGVLGSLGIPLNFFSDIHIRKGFAYLFAYIAYLGGWNNEAVQPNTQNPNIPYYYQNLQLAVQEFTAASNDPTSPAYQVLTKKFYFKMPYITGNPLSYLVAYIIQKWVQWTGIGTVDLVGVTWSTYLGELWWYPSSRSIMPMYHMSWIADYPDPHDWVFPFMHTYGYFAHPSSYSNSTVDALIEEGIATPNGPDRKAIYDKLQLMYYQDVPSVMLAQPLGRRWERDWVQGWYYNPLHGGSSSAYIGESVAEPYFYYMWEGLNGDINGDGEVNALDWAQIISVYWYDPPFVGSYGAYNPKADVGPALKYVLGGLPVPGTSVGTIDILDLAVLNAHWQEVAV